MTDCRINDRLQNKCLVNNKYVFKNSKGENVKIIDETVISLINDNILPWAVTISEFNPYWEVEDGRIVAK